MIRRFLAGLLGGLGVVVLYRRLRGGAAAAPADPAGDLRRKLDESRGLEADRAEFDGGETRVDEASAPGDLEPGDLEAKRRRVHERGRAALGDMHDAEKPEAS